MSMPEPGVCIPKPSPNFDARKANARNISSIILFDTGSNNCCGDLARLRNPASGLSAHYLVGRDGSIYQLVADKDRAWCSVHEVPGEPRVDLGEQALFIAIVNDGRGLTPYPASQLQALRVLVTRLLARHHLHPESLYSYPKRHVRHARLPNFDLAAVVDSLRKDDREGQRYVAAPISSVA